MGIRKKVESIIYEREPATSKWLLAGLSGAASVYGILTRLRKTAYEHHLFSTLRLPCYVISVGNITLGGTGKTPMTIYLARLIHSLGYRVAILSRGYGGSAMARGGVVSDGQHLLMDVQACGDEPFMMATALKTIPILVGRDRYKSGMDAVRRFRPDAILLDDAFQHLRLARDLDLILLDAEKPFGNERLFPRGGLREEKEGLNRGDAIVMTRAGKDFNGSVTAVRRHTRGNPLFYCNHQPYIVTVIPGKARNKAGGQQPGNVSNMSILKGRRGYVFSGIADNTTFQRGIEKAGTHIQGTAFFEDHHHYLRAELSTIMQSAKQSDAEMIITTEKDFSRIPHEVDWPVDLVVAGVKIGFPDDVFDHYIAQKMYGYFNETTGLPVGIHRSRRNMECWHKESNDKRDIRQSV